MSEYRGRHRKRASYAELARVSSALAGLADLIVIVDSNQDETP